MSKAAAESFTKDLFGTLSYISGHGGRFLCKTTVTSGPAKNRSAELIQHERSYRIALSTELECWYGIFQVVSER